MRQFRVIEINNGYLVGPWRYEAELAAYDELVYCASLDEIGGAVATVLAINTMNMNKTKDTIHPPCVAAQPFADKPRIMVDQETKLRNA